jgi:uncharacterized protein GlcG (DUF336 family)
MPRQIQSLTLADGRALIAAGEKKKDLGKMAQSGKPLFGIDSTNHEKVVIFGGGVPLKMGDVVVGALGASGGTVDQDLEVAEAAASAFKPRH